MVSPIGLYKSTAELDPIAGLQEPILEISLRASRGRLPVVTPLHGRRHRRQDRLDSPSRLDPVLRSAVVEEVELDVASPAQQLELPLGLAVGCLLPQLDQRQVGREVAVAGPPDELEAGLEALLGQVVEEEASDPARLLAMGQEEVLVAPLLQPCVGAGAERLAALPGDLVPVDAVRLESVAGTVSRRFKAVNMSAEFCTKTDTIN